MVIRCALTVWDPFMGVPALSRRRDYVSDLLAM